MRQPLDMINTMVEDASVPRTRRRVGGNAPADVVSSRLESGSHAPEGRQLAPVTLNVWLVSSPHKPDQSAGFAAYARATLMGPRTVPEWALAYEAFMAREVR